MPLTGFDQFLLDIKEKYPIITAKAIADRSGKLYYDSDIINLYRKISRRQILRAEKNEFFEKN